MHEYKILEKGSSLEKAKYAMILLHGRGGSAQDIVELAKYWTDEEWYIAAPQATNHTWYPFSFMAPENQNAPWLESAVVTVTKLLEETSKFIPFERIVIVGFSQGACLASEVSARNARLYKAVILLTGGLIGEELKPNKYSGNFLGTPIYLSNGDHDMHVPLDRSKNTQQLLESLGASVVLDIFEGRPHTILSEEIERVREFISDPIPPAQRK